MKFPAQVAYVDSLAAAVRLAAVREQRDAQRAVQDNHGAPYHSVASPNPEYPPANRRVKAAPAMNMSAALGAQQVDGGDPDQHESRECRSLALASNACSICASRAVSPAIPSLSLTLLSRPPWGPATRPRLRCRWSGWRRRSASWPGTWPR